jgi:hypothetical protein
MAFTTQPRVLLHQQLACERLEKSTSCESGDIRRLGHWSYYYYYYYGWYSGYFRCCHCVVSWPRDKTFETNDAVMISGAVLVLSNLEQLMRAPVTCQTAIALNVDITCFVSTLMARTIGKWEQHLVERPVCAILGKIVIFLWSTACWQAISWPRRHFLHCPMMIDGG